MEKTIIYLKEKKQVHAAGRMTLLPVLFLFLLIADKILYNIFYTVSLSSQRMCFFTSCNYACPECTRKMLESYALEWQKVSKKGAP